MILFNQHTEGQECLRANRQLWRWTQVATIINHQLAPYLYIYITYTPTVYKYSCTSWVWTGYKYRTAIIPPALQDPRHCGRLAGGPGEPTGRRPEGSRHCCGPHWQGTGPAVGGQCCLKKNNRRDLGAVAVPFW